LHPLHQLNQVVRRIYHGRNLPKKAVWEAAGKIAFCRAPSDLEKGTRGGRHQNRSSHTRCHRRVSRPPRLLTNLNAAAVWALASFQNGRASSSRPVPLSRARMSRRGSTSSKLRLRPTASRDRPNLGSRCLRPRRNRAYAEDDGGGKRNVGAFEKSALPAVAKRAVSEAPVLDPLRGRALRVLRLPPV